jgi:hypothetical protein
MSSGIALLVRESFFLARFTLILLRDVSRTVGELKQTAAAIRAPPPALRYPS